MINLKEISNKALQICKDKNHIVDHCIVVKHITANNFNEENSSRPAKRPCDGFKVILLIFLQIFVICKSWFKSRTPIEFSNGWWLKVLKSWILFFKISKKQFLFKITFMC